LFAFALLGDEALAFALLGDEALAFAVLVEHTLHHAEEQPQFVLGERIPKEVARPVG
jgi:hypothetical protein